MIDILIDIIREKGRSSGRQEAAFSVQVSDRRVPGKVAWEREFAGERSSYGNPDEIHFQCVLLKNSPSTLVPSPSLLSPVSHGPSCHSSPALVWGGILGE